MPMIYRDLDTGEWRTAETTAIDASKLLGRYIGSPHVKIKLTAVDIDSPPDAAKTIK